MKHIVLTESYEVLRISENDEDTTITNVQAEELAQYFEEQKLKKENICWGNKTISFINYVGYIKCSNFSIEILPKVSLHSDNFTMRRALIDMLNECGYINISTSKLSQLEMVDGSLLEIFGRIYANALIIETQRGITSKYQLVEENLMTLKGALVIPMHIKENLSRNKRYMAFCEYEDRIIDHELNQVLVAANHLLLKTIHNLETQNLLKQINFLLDEVTIKTFTKEQLTRIRVNRTNNRYEVPLLFAKQFLMNLTGTFTRENQTSFSFLFEMNELFEKYIAALMRKATDFRVYEQHMKYRLLVKEQNNRDVFQLKPDIVVDNGTSQMIFDTKWKSLTTSNRSGVKREDLFQMYIYLTRYECAKTAVLLYPQQPNIKIEYEKEIESWHLHADDTKKLRVYAVSLDNKQKTIEEIRNILNLNGF